MITKARVIAYYLPQFHPIPENDEWWGKGFTEWTNVGKAKPLFRGHYQPRVPADLGYYDLRMPEVREEQAKMAREAGIEGFCYWHYWFGNGKELLERPFKEVLKSGNPDFPFCLGWANHSWSNKTWHVGKKFTKDGLLIEQKYNGLEDIDLHFNMYLDAFKDKRYILVDGKCIFVIFSPSAIPDVSLFINRWNELAVTNGLKGFHFVGIAENFEIKSTIGPSKVKYNLLSQGNSKVLYENVLNLGFNAINSRGINRAQAKHDTLFYTYFMKVLQKKLKLNVIFRHKYKKIIENLYVDEDKWENVYPTIIPNWDRSARSGKLASIWYGSTPELFGKSIDTVLNIIKEKPDEHKIIFLQSWNEWAEGNYMEPDIKFGREYLNVLKSKIM